MRITVLSENQANPRQPNLRQENGLALYLELDGVRILFDCGRGGVLVQNAKQLGIDLAAIDYVIISHGHADHLGGLVEFFKHNSSALVFMAAGAMGEFYFKYGFWQKFVGSDMRQLQAYSSRIRFIRDDYQINPFLHLVTKIPRKYPLARGNKYLFKKLNGRLLTDDFEHELFLIVSENQRLNIVTGCSHNGIINILSAAKSLFPEHKINSLSGGFHLASLPGVSFLPTNKPEVEIVANYIKRAQIQQIYTGHCTGKSAYCQLRLHLGDHVNYLTLGDSFSV